jgi:hypothetical protein
MTNKDKEENEEKKNNWSKFIGKVFTSFFSILIIGILGANFVYMTRVNLDLFFPSDVSQRPYTDENKAGNKLPSIFPQMQKGGKKMKGGTGPNGPCGVPIDITQSPLFKNKYFTGMFDYGFPYSMHSKEYTFGGILSNWFVNKVQYSYAWLRQTIKVIIEFVGSTCDLVPESMQSIVPFIFGPVVISLIILIASLWWIPTILSFFWNENSDWGIAISIMGLFFGWTWFLPVVLTFFQVFAVIFSFIILPVMLNGKKIMEIMGSKFNSYYLLVCLLLMIIGAAFTDLNIVIAIVMTLVFLPSFIPPDMNPFMKKQKSPPLV